MNQIQKDLFSMQDLKFRDFNASLSPTLEKETMIGVRTPMLRAYAKEIVKRGDDEAFMKELPHQYYEENQLHAFIISERKEYETIIKELEEFLPFVDNWGTCDSLIPKALQKHTDILLEKIWKWIHSDHTYTIRFGISMLMRFYLEDTFKKEYLEWVGMVKSEEYYVNMMIAWYFATALAKQYDVTLAYLETGSLDKWVHNKTIQKARESFRITPEQKDYLKTIKK